MGQGGGCSLAPAIVLTDCMQAVASPISGEMPTIKREAAVPIFVPGVRLN